MPRNRSDLERDQKAGEVIDAAEELFLRKGYEATTMAAVAGAAGITVNAVYWYCPSKDHLLAAVSRRLLDSAIERVLATPDATLRERALTVMREVDAASALTASVHERARHSAVVADAHAALHDIAMGHVRVALRAEGLSERDADLATVALAALLEGLQLHDHDRDGFPRDEVVLWALDRLTS